MMDLRKLLPSAKSPKPADLDQAIADAKLERFRANAEAERLEAEGDELLLTESIETVAKHDQAIAAAKIRVRQADKIIAELERQAGELAEREAEAKRRKRYDGAIRERNAVEALLREKYPELAGEIVKILERLREAERQVEEANKDRPVGAEPIQEIEYPIRRPPGRAEPFEPLQRAVNLPNLTGGRLNIWPTDQVR